MVNLFSRSLTMTGTYPDIQCKLYKQKTNTYGLDLDTRYPLTQYAEKVKHMQ